MHRVSRAQTEYNLNRSNKSTSVTIPGSTMTHDLDLNLIDESIYTEREYYSVKKI